MAAPLASYEAAGILAQHATAIRALGKRVVGDVIEIGARLTASKEICGHSPEAVLQAALGQQYQALDATTPDLKNVGRPGKSRDTENNTRVSVGVSDTAAYALARLRKDRPDIHARVLAGEISAHAGMIEAGFRKKAVRKQLTPLERALKLLAKMTQSLATPRRRTRDDEPATRTTRPTRPAAGADPAGRAADDR